MLNNKNKKNNRNQFESKFDERTNVSLAFFDVDWSWLLIFWPELKTQAKNLNDFFYFQISLFDFFCGLCPLDFVFCVFDKKNKFWGTEIDYNWFVSPTICFFWSETQKKQNPGDTSHKKIK